MASNEYYSNNHQQPLYTHTPPPAPYYNSQYASSQQSTPAPSYHAAYQTPAPSYNPGAPAGRQHGTEQSPFDTVFDDNVYPVNSAQRPGGSISDISQHGVYPDTAYYGNAPDSRPNIAEDIPLQDRQNKDAEMNDHIYDAPVGRRKKNKKDKVGLGQLGMLGADKKRIPWVVYILTVAQIGVFIGEIIKNGTQLITSSRLSCLAPD